MRLLIPCYRLLGLQVEVTTFKLAGEWLIRSFVTKRQGVGQDVNHDVEMSGDIAKHNIWDRVGAQTQHVVLAQGIEP